MDAYLESLIPVTEEVKPAEKPEVTNISDELNEEPKEVIEESTEEITTAAQPEIIDEKPAEDEPKAEPKKKESNKAESTEYEVDKTYLVSNIKVFNTPEESPVFKFISGNVIFKEKVGNFYVIEYVKHGFGLVKGYTLSLS